MSATAQSYSASKLVSMPAPRGLVLLAQKAKRRLNWPYGSLLHTRPLYKFMGPPHDREQRQ